MRGFLNLVVCFLIFVPTVTWSQTPPPPPPPGGPGATPPVPVERIVDMEWTGSILSQGGNTYQELKVKVTIHGSPNTTYAIIGYYEPDATGENNNMLGVIPIKTNAAGDGSGTISLNNDTGNLNACQYGWAGAVSMWVPNGGGLIASTNFVWVPLVDRR